MNTNFRAGWLAIAFLCSASLLSAQKSPVNELLTRADRQYDLYSYNLAIQTYEEVLKEEKSNAHALARIGDCQFQLNRPEKAIEWYQKAQNTFNMESDVPLRLGKALMQTGDYDGAKDQFLLYVEIDEKVGRHFAGVADYAIKNARKEAQWQVKNEAINTSSADYGAAFYYNRIAFNSARTDIVQQGKPAADPQGGNTNYLFVSQRNPETELLQKPSFLRSDIQNNRNEGPVSFSSNGRRVAFCRNKFISGTRQIAETGMNMSIYIADVEDGNWKNVKAFTYNGSSYATGFPCLSPDGNKLLFASTQPGGFGGWDIYVSNWTATGWSEPRNLGTPLNSPGNEVTPFFDGEDLYFSSDWHNGFGGLDVFRASLGREEITEVFNLGPGVNSSRDDYGFIFNGSDNIGYLTSTRSDGRGNEDIWMATKKWKDNDLADRSEKKSAVYRDKSPRAAEYSTPADFNANEQPRGAKGSDRLHILVTDQRGFPLSDADVNLSDCYGGKGITGGDGKFYFDELLRPIDCSVSLSKKGYRDITIALRDFGKQNIKISLANDVREEFRGYVFDARTQVPIRGVTVQVQLPEGVLETNTDEAGFYSLRVEPGLTYLITYNKYGYTDAVVRTNLPYNSNNRIAAVNLDKIYEEERVAPSTTTKRDGYVEYDNTAKPIVYSDNSTNPITRVYPRETPKAPVLDKFNGYSIQLAAMPEEPSEAKLNTYESLTRLANLYVKAEDNMNKIRLGIYPTLAEAEVSLKLVLKDKAYKGSWIVDERGADETLIMGNENFAPVQHSTITPADKRDNATVRYAIQMGSFAAGKSISISDYTRLNGLGNLYSKSENGYTKVRLGVWGKHGEAEAARIEAIRRGFPDATIITERADDPEIRDYLIPEAAPGNITPKGDVMVSVPEPAPAPIVYSTTPAPAYPFYVRIAALSKPEDFDASIVAGLGAIEKRKAEFSPGMTIILLGSYPDMESANKIANTLVDMGYEDAHVVKEEKGKLIRK
ncbi:MAG: tetratricopeptide repeat protein [Saprospiraceae bacterium]|nr:tetratricopeptide repeat protein [Saprospiraceae bacterium]